MNTIQTMSGKLGKVDWETVLPMVGLILIILFSLFRAKGIEGLTGKEDQLIKEIDAGIAKANEIKTHFDSKKHADGKYKEFFNAWLPVLDRANMDLTYRAINNIAQRQNDNSLFEYLDKLTKLRTYCSNSLNAMTDWSNVRN